MIHSSEPTGPGVASRGPGPVPHPEILFTTAAEGNLGLHVADPARAQANRRALEGALGLRAGSVLYLEQVHGTRVVDADAEPELPSGLSPQAEREAAPEADAAVTSSGRPLAVMTADCLPVVITTDSPLLYAVAHAGRRGLLDGVLPRTVERLRRLGGQGLRAVIGPAVCAGCYEVPEEMAGDSERVLPGIRSRTRWGTPSLDLPGAAARQLGELGVDVEPSGACTVEDERLCSHRRAPGQGRIAGIIRPARQADQA